MQQILSLLSEETSKTLNTNVVLETVRSDIAADICCNFVVHDQNNHNYFCKCITECDMLKAEFQGLEEILATHTIYVPKPICIIGHKNYFYGLFEYLTFSMDHNLNQFELGKHIALMHKVVSKNGLYGYYNDNYIGVTPQINTWDKSWSHFFVTNRLRPQFAYIAKNQLKLSNINIDDFLSIVSVLLYKHEPPPSLCHGDLWSGNKDILDDGIPVIYDPAIYYGDRETDLAMTKLFNGFSEDFYNGYNSVYPLDADYKQREDIYILYHVLNHANMFGNSYIPDSLVLIKRILKNNK